uniref:Uncharacterized protein n=1 Tax=Quercus lobata TaxID=97700 RepID=A0A7N2MK21_QUELO
MESVYQYHCWEDDQNDVPNIATQLPCHCFLIRLYFYHDLRLEYPQRNLVPLTSFNQSTLVPCNAFFAVGPTILANIFSNTGVSQDFLDTATPSILSFASVMFNDARNIGRVLFPIAVFVLVVTPYDERDQIDRAIRESMEARTFKTVPAAKSSIDGLKKVRIDDFCSIRECSICLEEFCDGLEGESNSSTGSNLSCAISSAHSSNVSNLSCAISSAHSSNVSNLSCAMSPIYPVQYPVTHSSNVVLCNIISRGTGLVQE